MLTLLAICGGRLNFFTLKKLNKPEYVDLGFMTGSQFMPKIMSLNKAGLFTLTIQNKPQNSTGFCRSVDL